MGASPQSKRPFSRIRFKHLQIVDAITHYGSVHAAARGLNMTQPAISKILRDLEDQLGVELFERLPRGSGRRPSVSRLSPTPAGR